jgi:hypothetical protein
MLVLGVVVVLNTRAATCTVDAKLVNSCRPWLSAATAHYTMAGDAWTSSVQFPYFEKRLNNPEVLSNVNAATTVSKKLDFVHTYAGYGDTVSTWEKSMVNRANTYLQLNWKPTPGAFNLADGRDATVNSNIDKMANSIKTVAPKKIMLAVYHEPEDNVTGGTGGAGCNPSSGTAGSPTDYRNMWQNVRNRFDALGVSNVVWAMNYMGYVSYDCYVSQLWPGNHLVDWVLWDPYDGGSATYASSISRFYNYLSSNSNSAHDYNSKPWGLGEFGYWNKDNNSTPAEAVKYWQQAQSSVNTNQFPKLKLYSVFDSSPSGEYLHSAFVGLQFANTMTIDKNEQTAFNAFATAVLNYGVAAATPTPIPATPTPTPVPATATPNPVSTPASSPTPSATPASILGGSGGSTGGTPPVVTGSVAVAAPVGGKTVVKVNGTAVSDGEALDTKYLTNGSHTVTVETTLPDGTKKVSTQVIEVNNDLNPWEAARNKLFAGLNGDKRTINNIMLGLGLLVVLVAGALLFRWAWRHRPLRGVRSNLR